MKEKLKISKFFLKNKTKIAAILIISTFFLNFAAAFADFDPNKLIDDRAFTDTQTFGGPAGIQQFLAVKGSVLANTDPNFLLKLGEPQDSNLKKNLSDPEPNLGRLRTAAELIWDAAQETGINPQVIL